MITFRDLYVHYSTVECFWEEFRPDCSGIDVIRFTEIRNKLRRLISKIKKITMKIAQLTTIFCKLWT